jgi:sigma-B regulation protein RsbU (phosphoserine phosphatase)
VVAAQHALDTLRTSLASVDPRKLITPTQVTLLQSLTDNQSEILTNSIYLVNKNSGELQAYSETSKEKSIKELEIDPEDYKVSAESIRPILSELLKDSYAFLNLSKLGGLPVLAVLYADVSLKDNPQGMPVIVGLVSLKDFGKELSNLKLTIATRSGWILYDNDPTLFFSHENISENPLFKAATQSQVMNGAQEFDIEGVHYLGSYVTPGLNLVVLSKTEWQRAMKATYVMIEKFILLGSMAIGVAILFAILFSKTLTAPLSRLYDATKEVSKGNFLFYLEEKGRDEISALSTSFNAMSTKIGELVQESMEKVKLENEIAIASTVQQTLIPPEDFVNPMLHIHSHYQAASQCGGDWWGFFGVGRKVAVMIADATGHGFPSALITASARSCFSVMHKLAQEDEEFSFSPAAMLSYANRVIYDASLGKIMMTFFVAVIDFEQNIISYASAGHNPPWLFKKEGETFTLKSLTAVGLRLGETREAPPFEEKSMPIGLGDIIFLYTDGLTEGKNTADEMYGKKRVRKSVESNLAQGPEKIISQLIEDFLMHNGGKPLDDDVTIAAIKILDVGTPEAEHEQL